MQTLRLATSFVQLFPTSTVLNHYEWQVFCLWYSLQSQHLRLCFAIFFPFSASLKSHPPLMRKYFHQKLLVGLLWSCIIKPDSHLTNFYFAQCVTMHDVSLTGSDPPTYMTVIWVATVQTYMIMVQYTNIFK
jgi:hypothetical protein